MRETTDTNNNFPDKNIPDGTYTFKVLSATKKFSKKDNPFYVWKLERDGIACEQVLMPNMMGGLLRAIGCTETAPGKFDWDNEAVDGKTFVATVSHEPDKKDLNIMRQKMGDFKADESVPF